MGTTCHSIRERERGGRRGREAAPVPRHSKHTARQEIAEEAHKEVTGGGHQGSSGKKNETRGVSVTSQYFKTRVITFF